MTISPTSQTDQTGERDSVVCLNCGYRLRGLESDRCPECAFQVTRSIVRDATGNGTRPSQKAWSVAFMVAPIAFFCIVFVATGDAAPLMADILLIVATLGAGRAAARAFPPHLRKLVASHWIATSGWLHIPILLATAVATPLLSIGLAAWRMNSEEAQGAIAAAAILSIGLYLLGLLATGVYWWNKWRWIRILPRLARRPFLVLGGCALLVSLTASILFAAALVIMLPV